MQDVVKESIVQQIWRKYSWLLVLAVVAGTALILYTTHYTPPAPPEINAPIAEKEAFQDLQVQPSVPKTMTFLALYPHSVLVPPAKQLLTEQQKEFDNYLQSAKALHQANEKQKAMEEFEKARSLWPGAPEIGDLQTKLME